MKNRRLIVALDVSSETEALKIVDSLQDDVDFYKVGLQLLTAVGPSIVARLVEARKKVFLDLKLYEIPSSVRSAIQAAGDLGASMVTVHASGGRKIMEAATKAAEAFPNLEILGLTVVTSLTNDDLREVGIESTCEKQVVRLARLAKESGCHGLVASPTELPSLSELAKNMTIVTPGIRLKDEYDESDHARFDTPAGAVRNGASFIVLGRAIIQSSSPKETTRRILSEI